MEKMISAEKEELLISREKYLTAGVHIGMTFKTSDMKRFIYKVRPNGIAVLNIGMLDKRIKHAASMFAKTENVLIVARRDSAKTAVQKFCGVVGARSILGRFMPGSLTNPTYKEFTEPRLLLIVDPLTEKQAITEATHMRIPIIGFADTSNETSYIDLVLPANNKAKKSIALIFWLLAREVMKARGQEFALEPKDFGYE